MEGRSPPYPDTKLKHRPLTPLRVLSGLICLAVFFSTSFMSLVYVAPLAVVSRLFSIHYTTKGSSFFFGLWLALWPSLFEKINGTQFVFSGDRIPARELVLLVANHRTDVDWMYLWGLALRKGSLGYIKYILKGSLMKLPLFSWGFHVLEFVAVERKWETDELILRQTLSTWKSHQDPLWLAMFPEGTDFTYCQALEKCEASQKFAAETGLPVLTNVLLPKTRGFCACLETLRGSMDAVYDVTVAYKNQSCPCFLDNVFGIDPSEVHIHVHRVPVEEIPVSADKAASWLIDTFQLKDQLLSNFKTHGHFPDEGTEKELSTSRCMANLMVVTAWTALFTYLTFCSLIWFKIYVALSYAYLAAATRFKFHLNRLWDRMNEFYYTKEHKDD